MEKADKFNIPNEIIKFCDDICMSFLSLDTISDNTAMKHYSIKCNSKDLPDNDALYSHPDHIKRRNSAVNYFFTY